MKIITSTSAAGSDAVKLSKDVINFSCKFAARQARIDPGRMENAFSATPGYAGVERLLTFFAHQNAYIHTRNCEAALTVKYTKVLSSAPRPHWGSTPDHPLCPSTIYGCSWFDDAAV